MFVKIAVLLALLCLNAWFSTMEAAYFSVNASRLRLLAEGGNPKAKRLLDYMKQITKISAALRVGIVLSALLFGVLAANYFVVPFAQWLFNKGFTENMRLLISLSTIGVTLIVTYFVSVVGEMAPKRIGIKFAEELAMKNMLFLQTLQFISKPFAALCRISANGIVRMLGVDPNEVDANVTEEEIRMMVDAGGNSGSIDENEKEMINNIFELNNTAIGDIATHRTDIVAVEISDTLEDITPIITSQKYSRIPVYEENMDNIVGIFHVKDMAKLLLSRNGQFQAKDFCLADMMKQPYFVPFSKKTNELFEEMQREKVHMAIIIDEYGGTAGLVTMEDILEEIVGNIFDEYDMEEEEDITCIDEKTFLINGTTDLSDVEEMLGVVFEDNEDYDTFGGFLIGQLGRIPDKEEKPQIIWEGYSFQVIGIVEKRIDKVRVTVLNQAESVVPESQLDQA